MTLQDYILYVTNIPLEIEDEDLESIFSNYGDVVSIYRGFSVDQSVNTCFGFIEFSTIEEAEYAMQKLNGKSPYNFSITFVRKSKSKSEYQRQFKMKEGRNIRITTYGDRREITLLNKCSDESDHGEFECKENMCHPEEYNNDMNYRRERCNCNIVSGNKCYLDDHICHNTLFDQNNKLFLTQASFSRSNRIPFECNRLYHQSCNWYNHNCCSHCCHNMHSSCISSIQGTYSVCEHVYCSKNKTSKINRRDTSRSKYQQELSEDQSILTCHSKDSHSDYDHTVYDFPRTDFKSKKCFNKFHSETKPLFNSSSEKAREHENNQAKVLNKSDRETEDNVFEIPKNFNKHQIEQNKIMPSSDRKSMGKDKIRVHSQKNEFIKIKEKSIDNNNKTKSQRNQESNNFIKQVNKDNRSKKKGSGFEINQKKIKSEKLSENVKESLPKFPKYSLSSEKQKSEYQNAVTEKFEDFNIGMEIKTIVCFAYNPDELWLHKLPDAVKNLQELLEPLQIYCEQSENYSPQIGEICGALFSSDSIWYRAKINKVVGKDLYSVYFIDYGNTEIISTDNIRKLKSEFLKLPYQAVPCKLVSIKSSTNSWPNEALKIISSSNYVKAKFYNKVKGKYEIDLFDNNGNSLIDLLIKLNYAKQNDDYPIKGTNNCMILQNIENITQGTENPQNIFDMPSIIEKFQQGLELNVSVVISSKTSRDFWIHPGIIEVRENFKKMKALNTYGNNYIGMYNPKVNEIIVAQSPADHCWYRAFVLSKDIDCCFVYYLDYGNKEKVKRVVPILPEFIKYPSSIIHCIADDTCSEDIYRKYVEIDACLPGKIISVDKDKIYMDLVLENKKVSVTGYPWWYDLSNDKVLNENIDSACLERPINVKSKNSEFVIPSGIGSLKPGMKLKMKIVYCPSYNEFWVQPAIEEANEVLKKLHKLNEHTNKLDKYYPKELGEVVFAQSINDKCWHRAYVSDKNDDSYKVCFLDYGNVENVKNIFYISPDYAVLPCYAIHCFLELSNDDEFFKKFIIPDEFLDFKVISCSNEKILMKFAFIKDFHVTVIGYPWYHDLKVDYACKNTELTSEVIKKLIDENELLGKEKQDCNISSIISTLNIGNKIHLILSEYCGAKFSAVIGEVTLIEKIIDLEQNLQNECSYKTHPECNFKLGDLVAAFSPSDNTWYRACIMKPVGEMYLVRFVDYGKQEVVKVSNYLEEKYCLLPSPTIYIKISDVSDNAIKYLNKTLLTDKQIEAIVKECKDNKIYLELLNSDNEFYQIIAYPWDCGIYEELNHCNNLTETDDFHFKNNDSEELFNKKCNTKDLKLENYPENNENTSFHQTTYLIENNMKCIGEKQKEACTTENTKIKIENNNEIKVPSILKKLCAEKEIELTIIITFPDKFDFWAVVSDDDILSALYEMEKSLKEIPFSMYRPEIGDVIAAQATADDDWYRAYVLNENGDCRKVRYIDYGNEDEITNYKPLSKDQLNVMSPIIYCRMKDPEKFDNKEKLKQLLVVSKTILIKVNCVKSYHAYISILTEENELINNIEALPWYYDLLTLHSVSTKISCEDEIITDKPTDVKNDNAQIPIYIYENMKKLELCDFDNVEVKIVTVEDLHNLYVQPVGFEWEVTELTDKMTLFCENLSITSYIPKINEMVCAKFNKDNLWYRGCVISSRSPTSFLVHFVDFGNDDEVECKFLRPLPEQFTKNPIYGIRVTVEGLSSMLNEDNPLFEQVWKIKIVNINDNIVKLLNSDGLSLNEKKEFMTNEQREITVHKNLNDETVDINKTIQLYYYEDCKFIELPIGETDIIVTSIITPETIFCRLDNNNDISTSVYLNNDITKFCIKNAFSNYYPACGEMCLARYSDDGLWYRAVPLKIVEENLQVLFVDFGNIEIVSFKDTRQMMPQFMNFPIQAVHCMLSGILSQDWNTEVIDELLKVLPQQEVLKVKVLEKVQINNSYVYVLDIPFAREHLIKSGIAQPNC